MTGCRVMPLPHLCCEAVQLAQGRLSECLKQDGAAEAQLGKRPGRVGQALRAS